MLLDQIKKDIETSLREGNFLRLSTMRMILSAVRYAAINKYGAEGEQSMTDEDILNVIKKQAKERRESIDAYQKAGRNDLVQKEQSELDILFEFLPKELSDQELEQIIRPIIASGEQNMGLIMKQAMQVVQGKANGNRVSAKVKELLASDHS
jgi:hypothetical protein